MCSSAYALRSYLYILVHTTIAGPAALWLGAGPGMDLVYSAREREFRMRDSDSPAVPML